MTFATLRGSGSNRSSAASSGPVPPRFWTSWQSCPTRRSSCLTRGEPVGTAKGGLDAPVQNGTARGVTRLARGPGVYPVASTTGSHR